MVSPIIDRLRATTSHNRPYFLIWILFAVTSVHDITNVRNVTSLWPVTDPAQYAQWLSEQMARTPVSATQALFLGTDVDRETNDAQWVSDRTDVHV